MIRDARAKLGESQEAFAQRFGVHQSTVNRWETEGPPGRGAARKALEDELARIASISVDHGSSGVSS